VESAVLQVRLGLVFVGLLGCATSAAAQQATFTTGIDLVALSVTVTDAREKYVGGLQRDDFVVLENGVRQPVSFFAAADVPIDLVLLIDGSASMHDKVALVREAAGGLARSLGAGDRGAVVEFRDAVRVTQPLTGDLAALDKALGRVTPSGGTALYNALYIALRVFTPLHGAGAELRRRAIVVLSDGDDTSSLIGFDEVLDVARRSGVTIYTISVTSPAALARELALGGRRGPSGGGYALRTLARDTGGRAFFPLEASELKDIYGSIAEELGHQYAIGYVPSNGARDGEWRQVLVRVTDRPGVRPRTRTGYFAEATPSLQSSAGRMR
jgi:Ca-activated chloride channel family protein